jgi:hypothetical protein
VHACDRQRTRNPNPMAGDALRASTLTDGQMMHKEGVLDARSYPLAVCNPNPDGRPRTWPWLSILKDQTVRVAYATPYQHMAEHVVCWSTTQKEGVEGPSEGGEWRGRALTCDTKLRAG